MNSDNNPATNPKSHLDARTTTIDGEPAGPPRTDPGHDDAVIAAVAQVMASRGGRRQGGVGEPRDESPDGVRGDRLAGAADPMGSAGARSRRQDMLRRIAPSLLVSVVAPVVLYELTRSAMDSDVAALAIGAAAPAVWTLGRLLIKRVLDPIGIVGVGLVGIGLLIVWLSGGSPLALELRDVVPTGLIGLACLVSVLVRKPLSLVLVRLFQRRNPQLASISPAPAGPGSIGPVPANPAPAGPASAGALPTRSAPVTPAPAGPASAGPASMSPAPTSPASAGPVSIRNAMIMTGLLGVTLIVHAAALTALALSVSTTTYVSLSQPVGLPILAVGLLGVLWFRKRGTASL